MLQTIYMDVGGCLERDIQSPSFRLENGIGISHAQASKADTDTYKFSPNEIMY